MAASDPTATSATSATSARLTEYEIPLIALAGALVSANEGHEAAYLLVELVDDRRAAAGLDASYSTIHRLSLAGGHALRAERSAWVKVREAQTALRVWGADHGETVESVTYALSPLPLPQSALAEVIEHCTWWSTSREANAQTSD
jgi:hypothetical protein